MSCGCAVQSTLHEISFVRCRIDVRMNPVPQNFMLNRRMVPIAASLMMCATLWWTIAAQANDVTLWTYHDFPPFVEDVDREKGLSYALAERLNALSEGRYNFEVKVISRPRLNHILREMEPGMVLWANPMWFQDTEKKKFLWTDVILNDSNAVISPATQPFEYSGPISVLNKNYAGVRGHIYTGLEQYFSDDSIKRVDVSTEQQLIYFVAFGRAEVAVISDIAARYFASQLQVLDKLHFSKEPHSSYSRFVFSQPSLTEEHAFVTDAIDGLRTDPGWQAHLQSYGLKPGF